MKRTTEGTKYRTTEHIYDEGIREEMAITDNSTTIKKLSKGMAGAFGEKCLKTESRSCSIDTNRKL
jgi:hypothetical protein